jgi:hypothetical protein
MGYGGTQPLSSKHFFACKIGQLAVSLNGFARGWVTSRQGPGFERNTRKFERFAV